MATSPAGVMGSSAEPHFERSIAIFQRIKAENDLALACAGYGRFYKQQGRFAEARDYLTGPSRSSSPLAR